MPVTAIDFPILSKFACAVQTMTGVSPDGQTMVDPVQAQRAQDGEAKPLPKGVVLGPDGKPCRTCTSSAAWKTMMGQATKAKPTPPAQPSGCPPDVEELGRSTWTLLHTMTANYPERPSFTQQAETKQFISLLGKMYPCWVCADDFRAWMKEGNDPRVSNRDEFGRWMCEAHNAVNVKLGKKEFDCNKWEERWRTGWKDGSRFALNYDWDIFNASARFVRNFFASKSFLQEVTVEDRVSEDASDDEWKEYWKKHYRPGWHAVGSCAMLPRVRHSMVNGDLKVYSMQDVRL